MNTKTNMQHIILSGFIAWGLVGCSGTNLTKAQQGAIIGGLAGAVVGKSTSNHDNKRAVVGGVVGAGVGAAIGAYMDKQEAELRQTMEGTGIEVDRQGDNIVLNMPDSITFDTAKSDIKPEFHTALTSLASTLSQYERTTIKIAGHTDSRGSDSFNQNLSVQRANSVRAYLGSRSISPRRMLAVGYGESQPVADNNSEVGRAKNRRVEVTLVPIQQG